MGPRSRTRAFCLSNLKFEQYSCKISTGDDENMLLGQELMKVCHWPRINESMPLCIDKKIMMLRYGYQIIQAHGYNCDFLSLG